MVDFQTGALYSIDRNTGVRRVIADATTGTGPLLGRPEVVDIDPEHSVAYVLDRYNGGIFSIDLASGERRILTGTFGSPIGLALDVGHQRLYVADDYPGAIYRIDLATGVSVPVATGNFGFPAGIAYDDAVNRIIVIDEYPARLYSVDIDTGARSMISGQISFSTSTGRGPDLVWPRSVTVDADRQVAFVTDDAYDAVIAVDLRTGDRQVIAK